MANHSVEIRYINKGSQGGRSGNEVERQGKRTSATHQFQKKSSTASGLAGNIVKGIRTVRTFGTTATLGSFGGKTPVIAVAQELARVTKQGINVYASLQSAKTGERMKYHNMKQGASAFFNPIGFVKNMVWENGILRNMEVARENIMLEYDRQLTGDLIYSKNTQNTII